MGKRGKVRGMPGPGAGEGWSGGQSRGGSTPSGGAWVFGGGAVGGGNGGNGGARPRTKLKPLENRAKLYERPNTVVIDGKGFSVLPSVSELAHFMNETVLTTETRKELVTQIKSVYVDENRRQYLIKMETSDSMIAMADLFTNGITWPGYTNEDGGEMIVRGYSMDNPVMEITISGVGWWTTEETVRKAASAWGDVKEMRQGKINVPGLPSFSHIKTDKWFVKLVKKRELNIPGVVLHLGSERSGEEREMWKIWYRGVPTVCFKCFKEGHVMRECREEQVLADTMGNLRGIGEEEVVMEEQGTSEIVSNQMKRTFAQVLKEENYKTLRQEQEQQRKEKTAIVVQQATTREKKAASAAETQTVEVNMDLDRENNALDNRGVQECSVGTRRGETGEAPGAADRSGDDDGVIGFVSSSDEDNVSVVAMLDDEILAADKELKSLLKNLVKEPEGQWQDHWTVGFIPETSSNGIRPIPTNICDI